MHTVPLPQGARPGLRGLLMGALLPALFACGCSSMSDTDKGILGGGALGAGVGALLGSAVHRPGAGAAIGAGVGAVTGGLVGNASDKEKAAEARAAAATARGPLGLTDVVALAQQHISDEVIIQQIRTTGSVYNLSPNDIVYLKQNGVSDAVVQEMQMSAGRYPRRVYVQPAYQPVYVVDPPPPPPVSVGVGVGFRSRW
jgi:hypothetical protein